MAQFVQSNQLSPIQGSAGNVNPVGDTTNTADLITNVTSALDMAGKMYAEDKAKSIVNEEIENIDAAVAAAEERAQVPAGIARTDVPESLQIDQAEWDLLSNAVRSGQMTRDRARLLASSRLRTRIAEEPFYADRMRQSASQVLGFNIESEQAQQYFASFPTRGQAGEGKNKYRQEKMQQAEAISEALGVSVDSAYKQLVASDFSVEQKQAAAAQMELGNYSAQQFTQEFLKANHTDAWGSLMGDVLAFEQQQGKPVDGVAFSRIVREQKQSVIEDFNDKWTTGGGTLNTPEYNAARSQLDQQYQEMEEFVMDYGIDNLNTVEIERINQARELLGAKLFPQMMLVTESFGQQVTSDLIKLMTMNPTKRDLLMQQSPELKRAFEVLNSDPQAFAQQMGNTANKVLNGNTLDESDAGFVDTVATQLHSEGGDDTKKSVIQGLADSGANWKSLSILSESSPRLEPEENVAYYAQMYERDLPLVIDSLGRRLADAGANNYEFVVEQDGRLRLNPLSSQAARPSENLRNIMAEIDRINVFAQGFKKGWGRTIPDNLDQYKAKLNSALQQSVTNARDTLISNKEEQLLGEIEAGNMTTAGRIYGELKAENPEEFDLLFDEFLYEMRVRAGTQEEGVGFAPLITEPLGEQ